MLAYLAVITLNIETNSLSRQCRPRADAAKCGVRSESTLLYLNQQFYTHRQVVKGTFSGMKPHIVTVCS